MEQVFNDKDLVFRIATGKAFTAINRKIIRDFKSNEISITLEQWLVLQFLSYKDGISQQELAKAMFKDKPSITRLLDNLERHSLIARLADKIDKRSNLIHITKNGSSIHQKAREVVSKSLKTALNGISEEEIRLGERLLRRIFSNLE
jgi:DNA-binding MarR family transcriptional regulator